MLAGPAYPRELVWFSRVLSVRVRGEVDLGVVVAFSCFCCVTWVCASVYGVGAVVGLHCVSLGEWLEAGLVASCSVPFHGSARGGVGVALFGLP